MPAPPDKAFLDSLLAQGLAHHQAGRLAEAEKAYRDVLGQAPHHPDAQHFLGAILYQRGQAKDALPLFEKAAVPLGGNPDFHANFALALREMNRPGQAKAELHRALALNPRHEGAMFNLGMVLCEEGDGEGARALFENLAGANPDSAEIQFVLGRALNLAGRADEARERLRRAVALDAHYTPAWMRLAEMALAAGDIGEAAAAAAKTVAAAPKDLEAVVLMAEILERGGDMAGRDRWLGRAREIDADPAAWFCALGVKLREDSDTAGAARAFRRALALDPGLVRARWHLSRLLPATYLDAEEVARARRGYEDGLGDLEAAVAGGAGAQEDFAALAATTNFYLAYQERNDRDLQARFGRLARRVVTARFPEFAAGPPAPEPEPDGRLRIGFLSMFFHRHTVSRLYAGWLEGLDRKRFKTFGYYLGKRDDNVARMLRAQCGTFHRMPGPSIDGVRPGSADAYEAWFAEVCRTLVRDRLHALVFPEIGMDPGTFCLAALRFAPVQAVSWGHPETTGLETVDYFLSSALMEPGNGDEHYSEKLVRLPNISVRLFDPGATPKAGRRSRASFGFKPDEVVFLSSQSAYKYVPWYDRIYPAIARMVPNARFAFVRFASPAMDRPLLVRLARAFAAEGLDRDRYCRFIDGLSAGEFGDLNHAADVYLDTPGWSGGNTTHEALAAGLPVVTLPGQFMRGRHSYAMLRMIGVEDTIARDVDDYIAIAVRLGLDEESRRVVRTRIEASRHRLYNDESCVRALEDFLVRAVADKLARA